MSETDTRAGLVPINSGNRDILRSPGGRHKFCSERRIADVTAEMPQSDKGMGLAAAVARTQANECPGLSGIGQPLEDRGYELPERRSRMRVAKERFRIRVDTRRAAVNDVSEVRPEDRIVQIASQYLWTGRAAFCDRFHVPTLLFSAHILSPGAADVGPVGNAPLNAPRSQVRLPCISSWPTMPLPSRMPRGTLALS